MLRSAIILFFVSLVGLTLVDVIMLLNFFRRKGNWKAIAPELIPILSQGFLLGNYLDLLRKAHIEPGKFDRIIHLCKQAMMWSMFGSLGVFILLLLFFIEKK